MEILYARSISSQHGAAAAWLLLAAAWPPVLDATGPSRRPDVPAGTFLPASVWGDMARDLIIGAGAMLTILLICFAGRLLLTSHATSRPADHVGSSLLGPGQDTGKDASTPARRPPTDRS